MDSQNLISLLSCAGQLLVAAFVFLGKRDNPVAMPLGLLALDVFAWNFFEFAHRISGEPRWHYLDLTFSPMSPALTFHLVAAFTGQTRRWRAALVSGYVVLGLLSAAAAAALFLPRVRPWIDSATWPAVFVVAEVLLGLVAVALLLRHLRRWPEPRERGRTSLILLALVSGLALTTTDVSSDLGVAAPDLASLGTLVAMVLMAVASLRFSLLGRTFGAGRLLLALAIAVCGVAAYVAAFHWLAANRALLSISVVTITLIAVVVTREVAVRWATQKQRMESLATVGRFSVQMAHDLQNPLAALKGAVQFLREEIAQGRPIDDQAQFLDLIAQQTDRMGRVITEYRRLGRVEPAWRPVDLNDTVRTVLALQRFAAYRLKIRPALAERLPLCQADPDLLAVALENLVRNAAEAMPGGGVLTVRTELAERFLVRRALLLSVEDTGCGMDARQIERAFDDFFTTKATGSGLGLAYVRRVVQAHGGRVNLASRAGAGTTITIRLPLS